MEDIKIRYVVDTKEIDKAKTSLQGLTKEEQELIKKFNEANKAGTDSFNKIDNEAKKASKGVKETNDSVSALSSTVNKIGATIIAAFAIDRVKQFAGQVVAVTAEFQKMQAVLTNTLGSESAAYRAMSQIQSFAAKTPFSVQELTNSFVKLANQGFKPTTDEMTRLGDIASSTGKSFDQLAEAIIDAQTGEFERLKEFGIRAQKEGDRVTFTFKGVQTQTQFTNDSIRQYILSLGELNGVSGSMAAISETLTGKISNLGDSYDQFLLTLGNSSDGVIGSVITLTNEFLNLSTAALKSEEQIKKSARSNAVGAQIEAEIAEINRLTKAYQEKNIFEGTQLQRATEGVIAQVQQRINKLQEEVDFLTRTRQPRGEEVKLLNDQKEVLAALVQFQKEKVQTQKEESGILEKLRAQLKEETELREKALSKSEINQRTQRIFQINEEIKALTELKKIQLGVSEIDRKRGEDEIENFKEKKKGLFDVELEYQNNLKKLQTQEVEQTEMTAMEKRDIEQAEQDKWAESWKETRAATYEAGKELVNAYFEFENAKYMQQFQMINENRMRELRRAGDDRQAQSAINAKFARQEAEIRQKQAQAQKDQALFQIAITTAENVVKYTGGLPFTASLLALAVATGAIQASLVASRPIPKFFKGTKNLQGGNGGIDDILIYANRGEAIIPTETNRKYAPAIGAIMDGKIPASVLNSMVMDYDKFGKAMPIMDNSILVSEIKALRSEIKNKKEAHIAFDKHGFKTYIKSQYSETEFTNNYFTN